MPFNKETTLRVRWSKRDKDVMYDYPRKCDGSLLHYWFSSRIVSEKPFEVSKSLFQELEARGYDITTFKMSIQRKKKD